MTTTTAPSSRRLHGRDSSTIPTPRIHSSVDASLKTSHLLLERPPNPSISNSRRARKSEEKTFFYPHEIILEPQVNNKNANRYLPSPPEQVIRTTYNDLLEKFFDTHQPSFIFEPLRKEYYWTNEPFDQEKITRLEKLLQSTSFFVQSVFWYLRIVLAICITVPIEIVHTILAGLVKPILVRSPIILADTLIKPFHSGLFNALILPVGILLWNTSDLLARTLEPFVRLFLLLFEPCFTCVRSTRTSPEKPGEEESFGQGDGDHPVPTLDSKKTTLCV